MVPISIHPGEHLADELKALGMSANGLAKQIGVPTNRLTHMIGGKRGITGRYGPAPRLLVRHRARHLDESTIEL